MSPVTLTSQLGNTKINDKNSANFFKSKKIRRSKSTHSIFNTDINKHL